MGMAKTDFRNRRLAGLVTVSSKRLKLAPASAAPAEIDIDALFDSTMRRFPHTMARLAE